MKKLEKLKLNHLSESALDEKQRNALKGGGCACGCGGCGCSIWNGSGTMPSGQYSNDSGMGSVNANLSGTVSYGL